LPLSCSTGIIVLFFLLFISGLGVVGWMVRKSTEAVKA
jgi:hypothetical protein